MKMTKKKIEYYSSIAPYDADEAQKIKLQSLETENAELKRKIEELQSEAEQYKNYYSPDDYEYCVKEEREEAVRSYKDTEDIESILYRLLQRCKNTMNFGMLELITPALNSQMIYI